jgi:hypothetical protein
MIKKVTVIGYPKKLYLVETDMQTYLFTPSEMRRGRIRAKIKRVI